MSAESHQRFVERQALRAAQAAIDRNGRENFDAAQFSRVRIQTLEPGKRLFLAGLAFAAGIGGWYFLTPEIGVTSIILFTLSGLLLLAAIFGLKKTVVAALDGVDVVSIIDALF